VNAHADSFQPEFTNLVSLLTTCVERYRNRPVFGVRGEQGWQWMTYGQLGDLIDRFRAGLASLGVTRGDRVAVISSNRLEWVVGAHAVYGLGATYVPMYEAQLDKEWQYILADSGASVCLVSTPAIEARVRRLPDLRRLGHIVSFDGPASEPSSYAALLAVGASKPVTAITPGSEEIASLVYTSGTTGNPEGVCLTHHNLACNTSAIMKEFEFGGHDRGIAFLPWAHVFGGSVELNATLVSGGSTAICGDPTKLPQYILEVKPTYLMAVPRVWNRIYEGIQKAMRKKPAAVQWAFNAAMAAKNKKRKGERPGLRELVALQLAERVIFPKVRQAFGGNLKYACSGAAALSPDVATFIENLGIAVYEGYGMTESSGCTTAQPRGAIRLGSVGKAVPGVRIAIDRTVAGATDTDGELVVYGHGVMKGYNNLEAATREVIGPDGGLRTGDLGRVDADGYFYITGRTKELYKLENGKYVAPAPLEEKVTLSPYILQCVVFGADRPHNVALIVPDMAAVRAWATTQGLQLEGEALLTSPAVRKLLETEVDTYSKDFKGYERIRDFVVDTDELTIQNGLLTPTLKLRRAKVVAKYRDVFASLYPTGAAEAEVPRASYIRELRPEAASGGRSAAI
jgi:long-chain acyl-CoA synthetase